MWKWFEKIEREIGGRAERRSGETFITLAISQCQDQLLASACRTTRTFKVAREDFRAVN